MNTDSTISLAFIQYFIVFLSLLSFVFLTKSLEISSCLAYVLRSMHAHGKFGEHETEKRRVARGEGETFDSSDS